MAGHAQLKFVMTECSKTQIRLTGLKYTIHFARIEVTLRVIFMLQNTRVKANFGARPFAFAEGQQHREAADEANDLTREIRESFSHLPFNSMSDSEEEGTVSAPSAPSSIIDPMDLSEPLGPPCKTVPIPKPQKGKGFHLLISMMFSQLEGTDLDSTGPSSVINPMDLPMPFGPP